LRRLIIFLGVAVTASMFSLATASARGSSEQPVGGAPEGPSSSVLYDQTTGTPGGFVRSMISGNFAPFRSGPCGSAPSDRSCFAADDFTVPPGPAWAIESIHVDGRGGAGDVFRWEAIRADGLPSGEEDAPFSTPSSTAGFTTKNALPGADDFDVPSRSKELDVFDSDPALPPGHYWLSVSAGPPFATPSQSTPSVWEWQAQSPVAGSPAAWSAAQCEPNYSYEYLASCGQAGPDLRFRIEGQRITKAFSSLKIGKALRTPDGGLNIAVTFPDLLKQPGLTIRKVKGPGPIATLVKYFEVLKHGRPNSYQSYAGGSVPAILEVRPRGQLAQKLREGQTAKLQLRLSYRREINASQPIAEPAGSKTIAVVLKR
jgi:hypothetical protein